MTHIPGSASYETHARTRVGGWVLRGGYADSVPRGPDHPTGGRYPRPPPGRSPPLISALSPERERLPAQSGTAAARARRNIAPDSLHPMQERRHISVRALLPLVPPDPIPPTRAVPGAPLSVTRDTRKGRGRARRSSRRAPRAVPGVHTTHTRVAH